jgi:hypothetical protein
VARHLLLIAALAVLVVIAGPSGERFARLRGFVAAAVGIAAVGMSISLLVPFAPDLAASLLRFYWFRMSDVMVPVGAALLASAILYRWQRSRPAWHAAALAVAILASSAHLGAIVWWRQSYPWPPADANVSNLAAWREMCAWAASDTPADAVFLTPRLDHTFRWYASRAQVVSRKDIPQDAAGIVEWWRRNRRIYGAAFDAPEPSWRASLTALGARELTALGNEFGAGYVITGAEPALALERVGPRDPSYAIYRLTSGGEAGNSESVEPSRDTSR